MMYLAFYFLRFLYPINFGRLGIWISRKRKLRALNMQSGEKLQTE